MQTFLCDVTYHTTNFDRLGVKSPKTGNILWVNQGWFDETTGEIIRLWIAAENEAKAQGAYRLLNSTYGVHLTLEQLTKFKAAADRMAATKKTWNRR